MKSLSPYLVLIFLFLLSGCKGCENGKHGNDDNKVEKGNPTSNKDQGKSEEKKGYDSIQIDISGYIKDGANLEVILDQLLVGEREPLTATVVGKNDRFGFVGKVEGPGLFQIRFPSNTIQIVLTGGPIELRTNINNIQDYEIEGEGGAEATKDFERMRRIRRQISQMDDSLRQVLEETEGKKRIEIHKKLNKIHRRQDSLRLKRMKEFTKEMWEKKSIVAVLAATRMDVTKEPEFIRKVANEYKAIYPNNYFVESLLETVDQYDRWKKQKEEQEEDSVEDSP